MTTQPPKDPHYLTWQGRHGCKAKTIVFPNGDILRAAPDLRVLICCVSYHGDRDEMWIVELNPYDLREIGRYNCRNIEGIIWE